MLEIVDAVVTDPCLPGPTVASDRDEATIVKGACHDTMPETLVRPVRCPVAHPGKNLQLHGIQWLLPNRHVEQLRSLG